MAVQASAEASFEYSVLVVVIGAGACGLIAALAAHEEGADVLVLERDESPRGSTTLSQGLIPAAGTRLQRQEVWRIRRRFSLPICWRRQSTRQIRPS